MKTPTQKFFDACVNFDTISCRLILMAVMLSSLGINPIRAEAEASQIELQRGIQNFNLKHYSEAVGHLQQYVAAAPHESIGHYYLANCLFNLGYQKPCLAEYALALKESTSQKMTDYCRDAIRAMQSSKQAARSQTAVSSNPVSSHSAATKIAESPPISLQIPGSDASGANQLPLAIPLVPVLSPHATEVGGIKDLALEKTLVRMTEQSNIENVTLQRAYAADLESLKQHLSDDIFRLNRERDARIQALQDGVRLRGSSSSDTVDSIRKDTATKIASAQGSYDSTTKAREQQYLEQVSKLQNALRVSQDQVADARRVPGNHPNLQLAGTDLYTRNFIPSPKPPPPDELIASPERLVLDVHSRPGRTISRVVRDPAEPPLLPPGADLKVHGQLIPYSKTVTESK